MAIFHLIQKCINSPKHNYSGLDEIIWCRSDSPFIIFLQRPDGDVWNYEELRSYLWESLVAWPLPNRLPNIWQYEAPGAADGGKRCRSDWMGWFLLYSHMTSCISIQKASIACLLHEAYWISFIFSESGRKLSVFNSWATMSELWKDGMEYAVPSKRMHWWRHRLLKLWISFKWCTFRRYSLYLDVSFIIGIPVGTRVQAVFQLFIATMIES